MINAFLATASTPVVTAAMLEPIVTSIGDTVAVILPVGVAIMGTILGVKLVPRIFHLFF